MKEHAWIAADRPPQTIASTRLFVAAVISLACLPVASGENPPERPWTRHTILSGLKGSDGVRFRDVNGDNLPDCVTGWEQSGTVTICLHPGVDAVRQPWPSVRFKSSPAVEDAVFVDLDRDGAIDVVSCCEGNHRKVVVHWAPRRGEDYLDASKWEVAEIPAAQGQLWMFCQGLEVDGRHGIDLVVGSKGRGATVSWLESPANPRNLAAWKLHTLSPAGWVMSLLARDIDGDGDQDLLLSDRDGKQRGVRWLANPGAGPSQTDLWPSHMIGGSGREVMFLDTGDLDRDGLMDVVVNVRDTECLYLRRLDPMGLKWDSHSIPHPTNVGPGKAATLGDIDGDGRLDIVLSFVQAKDKSGVVWLSHCGDPHSGPWARNEISGPEGIKFDLAPLVDLDADGDLDVVTTEEIANLGIIWYENPTRRKP
jgi:hypothetical protein